MPRGALIGNDNLPYTALHEREPAAGYDAMALQANEDALVGQLAADLVVVEYVDVVGGRVGVIHLLLIRRKAQST